MADLLRPLTHLVPGPQRVAAEVVLLAAESRAFNATPIESAGGIGSGIRLLEREQIDPDVKICGGKGDG